ncbi:MAG: chromosome partitioning protein ParB [Coxiella sp. DG_40]|nr:MAG: chromosome partitioning protein ParB [Coxiella sp. DG_40]
MYDNKIRLKRGLNDLGISELLSDIKSEHRNELRRLPIDVIQPSKYQPRKGMNDEALWDLANSIRFQGVIQPIVVRSIADNRYEIVAGERRWRAAQMVPLHEIPAVIMEISNEAAVAISLIENIQRENLNVIEEAEALQRLISEFNMTHQEVANNVGKSRAAVTNLLRLLTLHGDIKTMLERSELEMGHARALLMLNESLQVQAAKEIVAKGLSVRKTEGLVKRLRRSRMVVLNSKVSDPNVLSLQNELADKLGARVIIQHRHKGSGRLVIYYNDLDELEGITQHFN